MHIRKRSFYIENLGCFKNQVDAEVMSSALEAAGWRYESEASEAGVILVNSCGFIRPAKEESLRSAFELAVLPVPVVMCGCLSERYAADISGEMPEIAGFFGNRKPALIVEYLEKGLENRVFVPRDGDGREANTADTADTADAGAERGDEKGFPAFYMPRRTRLFSMPGSAFVKVSEGCDNRCTFCAIPLIRGPLRSRTVSDVVSEIKDLLDRGIREINLIAQDLNSFGKDRGKAELRSLLSEVSSLEGDFWIRPMYMYPETFDEEVLEICGRDTRILPYFDIPFQHAEKRILSSMGRPGNAESYLALISRIRTRLPDSALRTSFLLGFPGESDRDLDTLLAFQRDAGLEWAGAFAYSAEEGTRAATLKGRPSARVAAQRKKAVEEAQIVISEKRLDRFVGRRVRVLVEEAVANEDLAIARAAFQAPEVDGSTVVHIDAGKIRVGEFLEVVIQRRNGIDMEGLACE